MRMSHDQNKEQGDISAVGIVYMHSLFKNKLNSVSSCYLQNYVQNDHIHQGQLNGLI